MTAATIFPAASPRSSAETIASPDCERISLPSSTLVPSRRTTNGTLRLTSRGGGHDAFGDHVAAHDSAEDVDQDAFDVGVREDQLESLGHALARGAAADVEKVGRLAAVELDDVHGGHGEPGAVHHAPDVAVELDVVEVVARRLELGRVFLVLVAQLFDVLVAEQRVVVEVHLGVERDQLAGAGDPPMG